MISSKPLDIGEYVEIKHYVTGSFRLHKGIILEREYRDNDFRYKLLAEDGKTNTIITEFSHWEYQQGYW